MLAETSCSLAHLADDFFLRIFANDAVIGMHGGDATDVSIVVAVSGGQSCALFTESQVVSTAGPYTLGVSVDPSSRFFGQAVGFYGITVSNSALDVDVVAFPPVS